ncbi:MAG: sulfate adenylyltransferase [Rhodospirillaceae bacterium]|nr:sulfate adenylyltransferase [Rhodospirillaceae bacterium]
MSNLVPPHGADALKPLLLPAAERAEEARRAGHLKQVPLSSREVSDLFMLGMGAYTPLDGFMGEADWRGCCEHMRLADGLFWPIPITLSCTQALGDSIGIGEDVALVDGGSGARLGILTVEEQYAIDAEQECAQVFRTTDPAHPGVEKVMRQGAVNLGGPLRTLSEGHFPARYGGLYRRPAQTRALFCERGWSRVAAFQTRNPMHRSHEHLAKIAIEVCDGVLIHQVLGALKPGDIPAEVRVRAIDALVRAYFVPGTIVQAGYPIEMRYAGPREALLHAVLRQNFGCSHLLVGRDHAGIGEYYGPFDAHDIFDTLPPGSLQTEALKIDITFYCYRCDGMATGRTCPHEAEDRLTISGTRLRTMFANREPIPAEFSRAEVSAVLRADYDHPR